jgi:KipI family sensor histidine kinase inhibitor
MNIPLKFSFMGEAALLCEAHDGALDLSVQKRIWALSEALEGANGILETVPGMNNLLLVFDDALWTHTGLQDRCIAEWSTLKVGGDIGRSFDIPVVYGGKAGEDLISCSEFAGMSVEDFIALHTSPDYTVFALGSQPGFAYLGGLDPALARPRRGSPRARLDAGSVIIGGSQAGVISRNSPSGWHVIGTTVVEFFNPLANPPALLAPGDRLRFVVEAVEL